MYNKIVRLWAVVCLLIALGVSACAGEYTDPGPVGLAAMEEFAALPYIWFGVQAKGQSSYDRTGGNVDRNNYLYTEGSSYVLLDAIGPGCVYRLWTTGQNNDEFVRFYLDNEPTPRINVRWRDLYGGVAAPFLSPLVGNDLISSGGFFSYLPVQFKTRCKITVSPSDPSRWFYYNIGYHTYAQADSVTTFTGAEDSSKARALWNSDGNPNPCPDREVISGSSGLPAASTLTIAEATGPAAVTSLLVRVPSVVPNDPASDSILRDVWIRAYWDGATAAAVNAPIGEFFGCGLGEYDVRSLPIRMSTTDGDWYRCYFPMPFGRRARIQLVNHGSTGIDEVDWEVHIGEMPNAGNLLSQGRMGYFSAQYRYEYPTQFGQDYTILDVRGRGVFVGCVLTMNSMGSTQHYLEGDERIYVDGSRTPAIYGTGTEDFFNGGWYFNRGTFSLQVHGNPASESSPGFNRSCYRFFLSDRIPYFSSIKVGIEHGSVNDIPTNYSSVAYFYHLDQPALVQTDELNIGDTASQTAHSYTYSGETWFGSKTMQYEGDDDSSLMDSGRHLTGYSQFVIAIHPSNHGVKLRRRLDYGIANQRATVYVDGVRVGDWYDAGSSAGRWRDSDLEISEAFTAGKASLFVRIESASWSEFRYQAFAYVDGTSGSRIADIKRLPDGTLVMLAGKRASVGTDQFADGFYVQDEDRSSGIRVSTSSSPGIAVAEGDLVSVIGTLSTFQSERLIINPSLISRTAGSSPKPIGMGCRSLGGASPNEYVPGIPGSIGPHNTGLLVTAWGRVTHSDASLNEFYIDDGFGRSLVPGFRGVQIHCRTLAQGNVITVPPVGAFVLVTGLSTRKVINGEPVPVIRPRKQSDILVITP